MVMVVVKCGSVLRDGLQQNIEKIRAKSYGYAATMQLREMDEVLALAQLDAAVTKKRQHSFLL